jgi:hypothetical protein
MSIWGGMSGVVGTPVGLVNAGAVTISLNMGGATAHAAMADTNPATAPINAATMAMLSMRLIP